MVFSYKTMVLENIFLDEVISKCYPENRDNDLKSIKERHILEILFNANNRNISQKALCRELNKIDAIKGINEKGIGTYINSVVNTITNSYLNQLKSDGIYTDVTKKSQGRPKKGESPSDLVRNWLWLTEFPRWRSTRIWCDWKDRSSSEYGWLTFSKRKLSTVNARSMVAPQPVYEIELNEPGYMNIHLDFSSDSDLLLLNRSISKKDNITKMFLTYPSQAVAPCPNDYTKGMRLPQASAALKNIRFDKEATEEFLAIIVSASPDMSWLTPSKRKPLPVLSEDRICQLWDYLNDLDMKSWSIFYQSFEVRENAMD